jgi:hypothetical protein
MTPYSVPAFITGVHFHAAAMEYDLAVEIGATGFLATINGIRSCYLTKPHEGYPGPHLDVDGPKLNGCVEAIVEEDQHRKGKRAHLRLLPLLLPESLEMDTPSVEL